MNSNQKLMTEKEKSYVSSCFNKNIKHSSLGISLDKILLGEQISYDVQDTKKEVKQIFGKLGKRSKKWQRSAVNSETGFLSDRIALSELFDTNAILKFVVLDSESKADLQESSLTYFEERFTALISEKKTFLFLQEFLEICSESMKFKVFDLLIKRIAEVKKIEYLRDFLSSIGQFKFDNTKFYFDPLWNCSQGFIMAEFLLKSDNSLMNNLLSSFVSSSSTVNDCCFYSFVNHLASCIVDSKDLDKLVKKLRIVKNLNKNELTNTLKARI